MPRNISPESAPLTPIDVPVQHRKEPARGYRIDSDEEDRLVKEAQMIMEELQRENASSANE